MATATFVQEGKAIDHTPGSDVAAGDVVVTVLTDSAEMYASRIAELREEEGELDAMAAAVAHERWLLGALTDNMAELGHYDRKRIHNLKYFTWVEQQAKDVAELEAQWSDLGYWEAVQGLVPRIDELIDEFNDAVGLLGEGS